MAQSSACQESPIDSEMIVKKLQYKHGTEQQRKDFESVLMEFDQATMRKFLLFVTNSDRPSYDRPIKVTFTDQCEERLPCSHTCFNLIEIPKYPSKEVLKAKLIAGFEEVLKSE